MKYEKKRGAINEKETFVKTLNRNAVNSYFLQLPMKCVFLSQVLIDFTVTVKKMH